VSAISQSGSEKDHPEILKEELSLAQTRMNTDPMGLSGLDNRSSESVTNIELYHLWSAWSAIVVNLSFDRVIGHTTTVPGRRSGVDGYVIDCISEFDSYIYEWRSDVVFCVLQAQSQINKATLINQLTADYT